MFRAIVCAAALAMGGQQDGPQVSARLSATSVGVGEAVVLEISVTNASGDVEIGTPQIPTGLDLGGTQDFTEMHFSMPGGRRVTKRREYALVARTPGRFRIPPVVVMVGKNRYRTNAVEIAVTGVAPSRTMESSEEAWLRATMSPETVYVGQQSTLNVEAGFSDDLRVRLTRPPIFDTPSPTGFWVQDIPGGAHSLLRSVNGRVTEIQTLQRAYFPLSPGRFALAPARAIIDVREGFLFAPETREIRSASPKLIVRAVPEAGRPADFRGAVGSYTISATVEPLTVAAGEAAQIRVIISGRGNIKAIPQPVLPALPGVEQFAPSEEATVLFDGAAAGGNKVVQWVIIPEQPGVVRIPAIAYSFFDPAVRAFRTVAAQPLELTVTEGRDISDDDATPAALRAIQPNPRPASLEWVRSRNFILLQLLPLLVIIGLLIARVIAARQPPGRHLFAALARLRDPELPYNVFLRDLENLIRAALSENPDAGAVLQQRAGELIQRIETQRFAPSASEPAERDRLLTEAESLLKELEGASRPGSKAHGALLMLMLLQAQPQSAAFEQGLDRYRAGQFTEAAQSFERAVAADSTDVAGWTNLGNSYFRAGDRGRAVWAWARAATDAPRDRALVQNLRSAGAVEVLRTRPPLSVRAVEWYFLAAIGWWVACAIAIVAIVKRRSSLISWALLPVLVAAVALIVGIVADHQRYAVALTEDTPLYGDPTVRSPVVRKVPAGAGLDILETRGDWLRVRTVAQSEGWVEAEDVGRL
jgi:hypothetical protein